MVRNRVTQAVRYRKRISSPEKFRSPAILLWSGSQVNLLIPSTHVMFSPQGFERHSLISAKKKETVHFVSQKARLEKCPMMLGTL